MTGGGALVRPASESDAGAIYEIESMCSKNPWSREGLIDYINDPKSIFLVLAAETLRQSSLSQPSHKPPQTRAGGIIGFACSSLILDELQINEVAVHPDHQGRGFGSALINDLLITAAAKGARRATLEVRISNLPAIRAYEKCGFTRDGVRKGYYQDGEDAALMSLILTSKL